MVFVAFLVDQYVSWAMKITLITSKPLVAAEIVSKVKEKNMKNWLVQIAKEMGYFQET